MLTPVHFITRCRSSDGVSPGHVARGETVLNFRSEIHATGPHAVEIISHRGGCGGRRTEDGGRRAEGGGKRSRFPRKQKPIRHVASCERKALPETGPRRISKTNLALDNVARISKQSH